MRRLALAAVAPLLLASAVPAVAQTFPQPPLAFTGPTRTYTVSGCGNGPLSSVIGSPAVRVFCLDGTATVGVTTAANGGQFFETMLDLTGTRINGFAGRFYDVGFSSVRFTTVEQHPDARASVGDELFAFGPLFDLTGRTASAYYITLPFVGTTDPRDVVPGGLAFGPSAAVQLGYVPADAPGSGSTADYGHTLAFSLVVTAVPEPATLALTFGGLAVLGGFAFRRRGSV